jgi:ATP-binding cassette, subfamily B, bacterial MsbA
MTAVVNMTRWQTIKRVFGYTHSKQFVYGIAVLALIVYGTVDAVFVWLLKPFIDYGFPDQTQDVTPPVDVLAWAPVVVLVLFSIRGLANYVSTYALAYLNTILVVRMRQAIFDKYLKLPYAFMAKTNSGTLLSKAIYEIQMMAQASGQALTSVVRYSVTILAYLSVMIWHSWQLTCCLIFMVPCLLFVMRWLSNRCAKVATNLQHSMSDITVSLNQMLSNFKNILMFGAHTQAHDKFAMVNQANKRHLLKMARIQAISQPLVMLIGGLGLMLVLILLNTSFIKEGLTAGTFASFFTALVSLLQPIKSLSRINNMLQQGVTAANAIFDILDQPNQPDLGTYATKICKGKITFEQVHFRYEVDGERVLRDVSWTALPHETIAIIGASGSGKSTMLALLTRLYEDLDQGAIYLDDVNIQAYSIQNLRHHFAYVSQETILFDGTIYDNIAFGSPNLTAAEIQRAAQAAFVTEFTDAWALGLQTLIGENGVLLSGGQRQRIALARAFAKQARVLVLDEATSSLDVESERYVQLALKQQSLQQTCLVIAHRLSTIEHADKVLVMDKGRVVQFGTHAALRGQPGRYLELYASQEQSKDAYVAS